MDYVL